MSLANYAVVRFIADPIRDEPINVGIVLIGDSECLVEFDPDALSRMQALDPDIEPDVVDDLTSFLLDHLHEPIVLIQDKKLVKINPDESGFLSVLATRMPRRFALGRELSIDLSSFATPADAVQEIMQQAVIRPRLSMTA